MARYIMQRLALGVVVLWGLASLVFFILHLVPGDPVRQALGGRASEETVAKVRADLGLDRPLLAQYQSFLADLIHGDLGRSIALNASVTDILGQRLPPSLLLLGYALLIAVLIGVPLGIWSALRPNGAADHGIRLITTFIYGMPAFWLGLMLALYFGLKLGWFPVSGYEDGAAGALLARGARGDGRGARRARERAGAHAAGVGAGAAPAQLLLLAALRLGRLVRGAPEHP